MYALEVVFVLVTTVLLLMLNRRRAAASIELALVVGGAIVLVLAFALGQARIHMAPAALVFFVCSVLLIKGSSSHVVLRVLGVVLGAVLIAFSVAFALAMPIVTLPAPDGSYAVGVASFNLVDDSRNEAAFGAPERQREIYVQVWYPGITADTSAAPRTLWRELYHPPILPIFFGYLAGISTHSYVNLPVAPDRPAYPVLVFSPSFGGIAEQNTLLMEHLASHGYVIYAVTHPHFGMVTMYSDGTGVPPSAQTMEATRQQGAVDEDALAARVAAAGSPLEASGIWLEYFERGNLLNDYMQIWVRDLELLVDSLTAERDTLRPTIPVRDRIDASRMGFIGMSYGGGAVTEYCRVTGNCAAVMNLDGGLWGELTRQPLDFPYLVLASPGNRRFFEYDRLTSRAPYYALAVEGTEHLNFTDVSAFIPLFDWIGFTGPIEGNRVIEIMNTVASAFFDRYVDGTDGGSFEFGEFPEVTMQSNGNP